MPVPPGTRFRFKTTNSGEKIRLAFAPGSNKVIEAKKFPKKKVKVQYAAGGGFDPLINFFRKLLGKKDKEEDKIVKPIAEPSPSPSPSPISLIRAGRNPNTENFEITENVIEAINDAAKKFNIPAELLFDIALKESSYNPNLVNLTPEGVAAGNPTGLFQFTDPTWQTVKGYAEDPKSSLHNVLPNYERTDPLTNALAAAYLISFGQLGRWDASKTSKNPKVKNLWGQFYEDKELEPYYRQTLSYKK